MLRKTSRQGTHVFACTRHSYCSPNTPDCSRLLASYIRNSRPIIKYICYTQRPQAYPGCLRDRVTAVNAQIGASDIARCIGKQERDRPHEFLGAPHLSLRNKRCPLLLEIRLVIENRLCSVSKVSATRSCELFPFSHLWRLTGQ